ncbi:Putative glycosyltransferase 2, nucleotide-diphospho-sugar transferase [Septoria linicola]|uniref:dolichyl-phosphate beta-glucosyltransferase n=1 Tax=Septoria linicola TaxID=215465 RepID=A0A9Q9AMV0_9PEZI|nr:putative glycosyltransferase 2, nucleotide-diphospho-sugar transferase [Septoria linicola]USW51875.1 Putative glycosyltransferase 2, nucleotide-diphospho-sugar transferase [Septoria linicola]
MDSADSIPEEMWDGMDVIERSPTLWYMAIGATLLSGLIVWLYAIVWLFAPSPRPPRKSEKQYVTITADGQIAPPQALPCWYDNHIAVKEMSRKGLIPPNEAFQIADAEVFMTLVIPAYNEMHRLNGMLEEAVEYLEEKYGHHGTPSKSSSNGKLQASGQQGDPRRGWEIILVSDGSTDKTVNVALNFARTHQLNKPPPTYKGPWVGNGASKPTSIPPGTIRVVSLEENRGKGGAVTHGMRHARGTYVVFADADGASRFTDLGKLVTECERVKDNSGRAVGVGSRAHMVGTEAVVKRSALRNLLMRAFHLGIWLLTTPKVAQIKDTQCGFKLFSRPSLPYIIPYMHSEGWIFDVEMLMLAESADIPMVEVAIGWKEVVGSKLNVIKDSIGMAVGLALLRVAWGTGIYSREK